MTQDTETWAGLNDVMRVADEAECVRLLKAELKGKKRKQFVYRIHSRLNRVRADRERDGLAAVLDGMHVSMLRWLK